MKLFTLTVPELEIKSDWALIHDRLLDDFPNVVDVLATTFPGTVLIVYEGAVDADAWFERVANVILSRRVRGLRGRPRAIRASATGAGQ